MRDQYQAGKKVKPEELTAGDLLFFTTTDPGPSHVAIAIGGDEFIHAPSSTGVVRVERSERGLLVAALRRRAPRQLVAQVLNWPF